LGGGDKCAMTTCGEVRVGFGGGSPRGVQGQDI